MIEVVRKGDLTKVVSVERQATVNLAIVEHHASGRVPYQPLNIVFYEGKGGVMRSSNYAIGLGRAFGRKIHATPGELTAAFAKAGLPVRIVTLAETRARLTKPLDNLPSLAA